jgi:hypothetical protein
MDVRVGDPAGAPAGVWAKAAGAAASVKARAPAAAKLKRATKVSFLGHWQGFPDPGTAVVVAAPGCYRMSRKTDVM